MGYVRLEKGLRQGDLLSPYLFVIVTEGLSSLLKHATQCQKISGLKIAKECLTVCYLIFADDILILCKATKEEALQMLQILKTYSKASGQVINTDKSSVFFGKI